MSECTVTNRLQFLFSGLVLEEGLGWGPGSSSTAATQSAGTAGADEVQRELPLLALFGRSFIL